MTGSKFRERSKREEVRGGVKKEAEKILVLSGYQSYQDTRKVHFDAK